MIFLITGSLASCQAKPIVNESLGDVEWKFHELVPMEEPVVCVKKEDFIKIKRKINMCEGCKNY